MLRFAIFLFVVILIYSAMHALAWWMASPFLEAHPRMRSAARVLVPLAVLSPILVQFVARSGIDWASRLSSLLAFSWMGLLFLAFSFSFVLALYELGVFAASRFHPAAQGWSVHGPRTAGVILCVSLLISIYGIFEARAVRIERVQLSSSKLAAGSPPIRLALVTDLHLGQIHREGMSRRVLSLLESSSPDALLVAGDFVDDRLEAGGALARLWGSYEPPLGKLAIVGNHEIYPGLRESLAFLESAGFRVLRNESQKLSENLAVTGVDDPQAPTRGFDSQALFSSVDTSLYNVLLQHRPTVEPGASEHLDLQLSGHAHRGQIFPFTLLTGIAYPLQCGLHHVGDDFAIYTSPGTGTWGPPMRVLAPPEVTLIEISPARAE